MGAENDEVQISKLEVVLMVGIIGCMLFATWELAHLMLKVFAKSPNKWTL